MKNILYLALLLPLFALPGAVSAAALYDGSGFYMQATLDGDIEVDVDVRTDTGGNSSTGEEVRTASTSTTVDVETSAGSVRTAFDVATENDLAIYSESLRSEDSNIDQAEADVNGDVVLTYYHPVRLFGIVPMQAKTKTVVSVNNNGMLVTRTSMPWWGFFAVGTGSIASAIDTEIANSGEVLTDMKLSGSAAARARVLEAVAEAHARLRASTTSSFLRI
jgi:hypothetical protein